MHDGLDRLLAHLPTPPSGSRIYTTTIIFLPNDIDHVAFAESVFDAAMVGGFEAKFEAYSTTLWLDAVVDHDRVRYMLDAEQFAPAVPAPPTLVEVASAALSARQAA